MLKDNAVMKKLVATGEERVGKIAQQLLSNEKFVTGLQTVVSRSLAAKGALDKSIRTALGAMNLPSTADLDLLKEKVEDLERVLSSIENKVETLAEKKK
jgi:hypothetical protein